MEEENFFRLREAGKTYISKVFKFSEINAEEVRNVRMILEGADSIQLGELQGAMCLRITGQKRKTQVTALVTQDEKHIRRVSLLTFKSRSDGSLQGANKIDFTFRHDEFLRLIEFLHQIKFLELSNKDNFQIKDISQKAGPKAIIDADELTLVRQIRNMKDELRQANLVQLGEILTVEDVNVLLGRRKGLDEFTEHLSSGDWNEAEWQNFFERQKWIFGYGLDYRIMRPFGREMVVGSGGGTSNRDKPIVDFLSTFREYTVIVEIKKPNTKIFKK